MNCGALRCIACQIGHPIACAETERAIRLDERLRITRLVTKGINRGDLSILRENLRGDSVRTAQLLVHALVQVLDIELDDEGEAA